MILEGELKRLWSAAGRKAAAYLAAVLGAIGALICAAVTIWRLP